MASSFNYDDKTIVDQEQNGVYQKPVQHGNHVVGSMATASDVVKVIEAATTDVLQDTKATRKVLRKIDWRLMPILSITFSFSLIDRINLPNVCRRCKYWTLDN